MKTRGQIGQIRPLFSRPSRAAFIWLLRLRLISILQALKTQGALHADLIVE
jgi:hypothetical protein